jgi:hypothetical protein
MTYKDSNGKMASRKKDVAPYIIPIEESEKDAYDRQRIQQGAE